MAGQTSIDVNKTDWVFWFTPLPHQHGISTSPQPPPAVHKWTNSIMKNQYFVLSDSGSFTTLIINNNHETNIRVKTENK